MKIQFSGSENEFLNCNVMEVSREEFAASKISNLKNALEFIFRAEPRAHKSFFKSDGTLANGTICLVDEVDADIKEDQSVNSDSELVLISTLHGG